MFFFSISESSFSPPPLYGLAPFMNALFLTFIAGILVLTGIFRDWDSSYHSDSLNSLRENYRQNILSTSRTVQAPFLQQDKMPLLCVLETTLGGGSLTLLLILLMFK